MPPSYLDWVVFLGRDEVQAPLLLVLLLVAETLKDDVGLIGLAYCHHLHVFVLEAHDLGEGVFANLALELGEVVGCCDPLQLLLHLAVYPSLQATHMDGPAAALAVAWRN